jgi:hypothetical protein
MRFTFLFITFFIILFNSSVKASESSKKACSPEDKICLLMALDNEIANIENERWRDQTYREQAKLLTLNGKTKKAISIIDKIQNPDTKAMTIRGIGMAAAEIRLSQEHYQLLFAQLLEEAEKIEHPPSYAIALTYIAMSQAFAKDDKGAMLTAKSMENDALRNKAFGETAEIQAERGDLGAALTSIAEIDDLSFKNKAYKLVSKIFANNKSYESAYKTAQNIENSYLKSQAILYILTKQVKPEEVSIE